MNTLLSSSPAARSLARRALAIGVSACFLAACGSTPTRSPELVRLEGELSRLQSDPIVAGNARVELSEAQRAIDVIAEDGRRMKSDLYDHNVYIATRLLQIAEAEGRATGARLRADELAAQREGLVADARTLEADRARRDAERSRMIAGDATRSADQARADAEAERLRAQFARDEADIARAELQAMRTMLTDLQAKQTERGLVVTLGDVLFETDRSELKPGAQRNLDKLVAALGEHDKTTVAIEGHTDSTGGSEYNQSLSQRRAQSVETYLTSRGIDRSRLTTSGLGQDYPVASNTDGAGRQQNRRVEIIIQNASVAAR
jgi:outer membrane protein OmpA-like peptidoglycan-associated protein